MGKLEAPLVLIGYMASGKTSTAKELGNLLSSPVWDLDEEIERRTGRTPAQWIREKGEVAFRKAEATVLKELPWEQPAVVSVGGGTPCYGDNLAWMKEHGTVIYLQWPIPVLVKRLQQVRAVRPLLDGVAAEDLAAFVGAHVLERNHFYGQASIRLVLNANESPREVALRIEKEILNR